MGTTLKVNVQNCTKPYTGLSLLDGADKEIASMGREQVRDILHLVDEILGGVEDAAGATVMEMVLPKSVETVKSRHYKTMDKITADLEAGKISLKSYERKAHNAVSTNFTDAYAIGRNKKLDAGDLEYLSRATNEEMKYARRLGRDISEKRMKMPRQQRVGMYAETVDSLAWAGKVESLPSDSRIDWVLAPDASHCIDCLILGSQSPFNLWNLPTQPKSGATSCKTRCRCKLVVRAGRMSKAEMAEANQYASLKDQDLTDMLAPGEPPKGLRVASDIPAGPGQLSERQYIDSLWNRIDYNRRIIATSQDAVKVKAAIKARKSANAELIEFLEKEKIYETPLWSVDEIINETHLSGKAESGIFRHGIDGDSLEVLGRREVASLVARYEREVGEKFKDLPKYKKPKINSQTHEVESQKVPIQEPEVKPTEYSLVADNLHDTFRLLGKTLLLAIGKAVQVGPLNDEFLSRTYLWVRGEDAAVLLGELEGGDIDFVAVPVEMPRRKGK